MRRTTYKAEKRPKRPLLTYVLIGVILLAFAWEMWGFYNQKEGWLDGQLATYGFSMQAVQEGKWWTPFTSVFLHAGLQHLMLNILALFFFGRAVELELGWKKSLVIFWAGALVGDIAVVLVSMLGIMPAGVPTIGASAAIFGLMGGAVLAEPLELVFYPYIVPVPMLFVAALYVLYNIASFVTILATGAQTNIAYAAHLGGLAAGICFAFRWVGMKKGIPVLLGLFLLLMVIPLLWSALQQLQLFNYVSVISGLGQR